MKGAELSYKQFLFTRFFFYSYLLNIFNRGLFYRLIPLQELQVINHGITKWIKLQSSSENAGFLVLNKKKHA